MLTGFVAMRAPKLADFPMTFHELVSYLQLLTNIFLVRGHIIQFF